MMRMMHCILWWLRWFRLEGTRLSIYTSLTPHTLTPFQLCIYQPSLCSDYSCKTQAESVLRPQWISMPPSSRHSGERASYLLLTFWDWPNSHPPKSKIPWRFPSTKIYFWIKSLRLLSTCRYLSLRTILQYFLENGMLASSVSTPSITLRIRTDMDAETTFYDIKLNQGPFQVILSGVQAATAVMPFHLNNSTEAPQSCGLNGSNIDEQRISSIDSIFPAAPLSLR